jgi:hypothetical protein
MARRRPRPRTVLVTALVAIVVLVLCAPALVQGPLGRALLARAIERHINAEISIADLSLSWAGPQLVGGLRIEHPDGTPVALVDVTIDETLGDLWSGNVEHWNLDVAGRLEFRRGTDRSWTWFDLMMAPEAGGQRAALKSTTINITEMSMHVQAESGDSAIDIDRVRGAVSYGADEIAIDLDGRTPHGDFGIHGTVVGTIEVTNLPGGTLAPLASIDPALLRELAGGPISGTLVSTRGDDGLDLAFEGSSPRAMARSRARWSNGEVSFESGRFEIRIRPSLLELLDDDDDRAFTLAAETLTTVDIAPFIVGAEEVPITVSAAAPSLTGKALREPVLLNGLAGEGTIDPDRAAIALTLTADLDRFADAKRLGAARLDLEVRGHRAGVVVTLSDLLVAEAAGLLARSPGEVEKWLGSTGAVTIDLRPDRSGRESSPTRIELDFERLQGNLTITRDEDVTRVTADSEQLVLEEGEEKRRLGAFTLELRGDGDSTVATLDATDTPTILHDAMLGAQGTLVAALGPTVDLEGTLTATGKRWTSVEARVTAPGSWVEIALERAGDMVRTRADQPLRAELALRPELCGELLTYIHPALGDLCTTAAPIRMSVANAQMPSSGDFAGLDADVEIIIGAAELDAKSGMLAPLGVFQSVLEGLTDSAAQNRCQFTVPGSVEPMRASIRAGVVTYEEFVIYAGEHRLPYTGYVDLGKERMDVQTEVAVSALGPAFQNIGVIPTGITLPVRTKGSFDSPQTNVEIAKLIGRVPEAILKGIVGGKEE